MKNRAALAVTTHPLDAFKRICYFYAKVILFEFMRRLLEGAMAVAGIGLGDLILTTAQEIRKARDESAKSGDPVLTLEGCELELKVTISVEGSAGIKVWLLDLSTEGSAERASTITLRFGPAGKQEVFLVAQGHAPHEDAKIVPKKRASQGRGK
jgi:hypothetical protein